jgi:hypothetical protein
MTCDESIRLIACATEGRVGPGPLRDVISHLEVCTGCCREAEAQMEVKRVLAARAFERCPDRLTRAIGTCLDAEDAAAEQRRVAPPTSDDRA